MAESIRNYPKSEAEFIRFIEEIDDSLKKKNILIFQRPIHAIREACLKLKISIRVAPDVPPTPGIYEGDYLAAHIHEWYKKKYGDRVKINFSPGCAAVLIKGDPWKIDFPLVFGNVKLVFDPDLEKYQQMPEIAVNAPLLVNPLRSIRGLTTEHAKSLKKEEMQKLAQFFLFALNTIQRLFEIKDKPYIPEARADLNMAVNNLFLFPPNYGQSKWASLQFAEKLFKCYLRMENVSFPLKHDLKLLARLAFQSGLQIIPDDVIKTIQCPAGVRYGEITVTLPEAISAHHASLEVCSVVANTVARIRGYDASTTHINRVENEATINEGRFYVAPSLNFYYYCDKIEGNLIHWILVESYHHGDLIQVEFTQLKEDAIGYVAVSNERKIRTLEYILEKLRKEKNKG